MCCSDLVLYWDFKLWGVFLDAYLCFLYVMLCLSLHLSIFSPRWDEFYAFWTKFFFLNSSSVSWNLSWILTILLMEFCMIDCYIGVSFNNHKDICWLSNAKKVFRTILLLAHKSFLNVVSGPLKRMRKIQL